MQSYHRVVIFAATFLISFLRADAHAQEKPGKPVGVRGPVGCSDKPKKVDRLQITKSGVYENYLVDSNWQGGNRVKITADDVTIRNCEIRNATGNGIGVFAKNVVIENCKIHHLLNGSFTDQKDAHGITGYWANLTIRNCEIYYVSGDAVQFDPDRKSQGKVLIEDCTFWTGPLPADAHTFKKGERPGENAIDTKTKPTGPRCEMIVRNCYFHGWNQPAQIGNVAALNIKENVHVKIEHCILRDNEIAFRLRGPTKKGGANVEIKDCAIYDSKVGVRFEDKVEDVKIKGLAFGPGVDKKYHKVAGSPGKGYENVGERTAPALETLLKNGFSPQKNSASPKGRGEVTAAIEKALPLLQAGADGHIAKKTCFACHNQAQSLLAITTAKERGFALKDMDLAKQTKFIAGFLGRNKENYLEGKGQGGQADTAGYALFTLDVAGWPRDDTTAAVVEYLLRRDEKLDHWRPVSSRPPSEASVFTTNYLAIRALKKWGADDQKERIDKRLDTVRGWLVKTPAKDTEDRVFRLFALQAIGEPVAKRQPAIDELLQSQRKDGGWAQTDKMGSDAYATGSALVALHQAGNLATAESAYQRGIAFLLMNQQEDGSWHIQSRSKPFQVYYESGFPHGKDQFISAAASGWATTALALTCAPAKQNP